MIRGRSTLRRIGAALLGGLALLSSGPNGLADEPRESGEDGRAIYNFRCYFCHGYSGDAHTLAATFLLPPPRDFRATALDALSREQMIDAVSSGRPGTAMQGFSNTLTRAEIESVVDFVREEFMRRGAQNTRYHTDENGWPRHERYADAFPFATGELTLDTPAAALSAQQRAGRELFLSTCVSCHDRSHTPDASPVWQKRALSFPRTGYSHRAPDAISAASPYALHDRPPDIADLTPGESAGEELFQNNCAFCHAADGTGQNWIGTFLEPSPRDLTDSRYMRQLTREKLGNTIRNGIAGTSMPAWRDVLSATEIEQLIDYIVRAFHAPDAATSVPEPH